MINNNNKLSSNIRKTIAMRINKIKTKLNNKEIVTIVSGDGGSEMIDFLGPIGVDGIWLEGEHGSLSWEQIGNRSRACDLLGNDVYNSG